MSKTFWLMANWKMQKDSAATASYFRDLAALLPPSTGWNPQVGIVVFPPFPYLMLAAEGTKNVGAALGAQDIFWENYGAFTGEVCAAQLKDCGCQYVLVGHSERRRVIGESDEIIAKKTLAAVTAGLIPVLCVGETLEERNLGRTEEVLARQLHVGQSAMLEKKDSWLQAGRTLPLVVAYEPVWAIGTSVRAEPAQIRDAHAFCRTLLQSIWGAKGGAEIPILYGGSVAAANLNDLLAIDHVNGALIGGASLKPDEMASMVKTCCAR